MMSILLNGCAVNVRIDDGWVSCNAVSVVYVQDPSSLTRQEKIKLITNNEIIEKYCP